MSKYFTKTAVTPKVIMPIVERNVVKQLETLSRARNELTGPGWWLQRLKERKPVVEKAENTAANLSSIAYYLNRKGHIGASERVMRARQPIREDIDRLDYIKDVLATRGNKYG